MLLRREGYDLKADNVWGPITQKAWVDYRTRQVEGEQKNLVARQHEYLKTAFSKPPNPKLERELFGEEGVKDLQAARTRLDYLRYNFQTNAPAGRITKHGYVSNDPYHEDDDAGFVDMVKHGTGRAAHTVEGAARAGVEAEKSLAEHVLESIKDDPTALAGIQGALQNRVAQEAAVGTELTKAAHGEKFSPGWAGVEAAGVIPFLKPLRALRAARGLKAAEEATPAAERAVDDVLEEAEPTAADKVREALNDAPALRTKQEALRHEERVKRVGEAIKAGEGKVGLEGLAAEKEALRGELPRVKFIKLQEGKLSQEELEDLFTQVKDHPRLSYFGSLDAREALRQAFQNNRVPSAFEEKLLRQVFGDDVDELIRLTKAKAFKKGVIETLNIPRSLMASFDLSAPFRQALVAGAGHPRIFAKNFKPMLKAAFSDKDYAAIMDDIAARPNTNRYIDARLSLTDLEDVSNREEQFMSNFAERLNVPKKNAEGRLSFREGYGPGKVVRGSGRAYVAFLNKMRADIFDSLIETARKEGRDVDDIKFLRDLGSYINKSTGRGNLGPIESWAPALNTLFFSPRLAASRVGLLANLADPTWYFRVDPFVRRQQLQSMMNLAGAAGIVLSLAGMNGATIGLDPRNADFAKIRVGNTRIDVLGGFQQYIRLISQLMTGTIISSSSGRKMTLGAGFGDMSRKDITERFGVGKFAPPPSLVYDFFKGTDFEGNPFSWKKAIIKRMVPLMMQDIKDLYDETGNLPLAAAGYGFGALGFGVQTYGPRDVKKRAVESLREDAEKVGLTPDAETLEDVEWRARLDQGYDDLSALERAERLAELYDERYGGTKMSDAVKRSVRTDAQARAFTKRFRQYLYPRALLFERQIHVREDAGIGD